MKLFFSICSIIAFASIMFLRQATTQLEVNLGLIVITIVFVSVISSIMIRDHMEEI